MTVYRRSCINIVVSGPVLCRSNAGPALEGATEGAEFGECEEKSDFAEGILVVGQIAQGFVFARLFYQVVKAQAFFFQAAVQGLPAHMALLCQGVGINPVGGHLPGNQSPYFSAE